MGSKTNNVIGKCYSSSCRAEFADKYCQIKEEKYISSGAVTHLAGNNSFLDSLREEPDDYFTKGILTFVSGVNKGRKYNITQFRDKKITLEFIFALKITIGDQYKIIAGCDKSIDSCINKFNNAINFRGEPYVPNRHQLVVGN